MISGTEKLSGRLILLTTTAGICMATASAAQAAGQVGPEFAEDTAFSSNKEAGVAPDLSRSAVSEASAQAPEFAIETPQIVVPGPGEGYSPVPGEPGSLFDDAVDVNGVGQFYRADGFVCTGTLINPRTVLFAAHCVNDIPADAYGSNSGGLPAAFAFQADALDGLRAWIQADFGTVTDAFVYNVEQMLINQDSLRNPQAQGFLEADVALAVLDTPAANVPTWAMLFSPLPAPGTIDTADGTGYDVRVTGYGRSGVGATGATAGIDYRRRAAENVIGILGSLNDRNQWLFGPGDYGLPQNLYQTDFDDPSREAIYDFNLFKDDARGPEGSTAGGDSGGPLILTDTFARELVIGVLSGGSRFFLGQPDSSYGTSSIYQPLYPFWDWIVANSPYRYTQSLAGDGNWSDPDHWQTALDPNFFVLDENGVLVNGVPDTPGEGIDATDGKFGQVCDGVYCFDLATGDVVDYEGNIIVPATPITEPEGLEIDGNNIGAVDPMTVLADARSNAGIEPAVAADIALAEASLANGLPGASGYVPSNRDFSPGSADSDRVDARYFDVTLAAAGTTTLDTDVVIDKFTIAGENAALDITSGGSLTSLIDVTQMAGMMNVDGTLSTNSDYLLFTGALTGNGTVETPFFTNMMGIVAPGTMGSIGTLDFNGNIILASGSFYSVDFGPNGASDLIRVNATQFDEDDNPLNGVASIGGTVLLNPVGGAMVRYNDSYTILQAEGGYEGAFQSPDISAILKPEFTYNANSITLSITAASYASVIDGTSPIQSAFAQLLDQNRVQYGRYADLYGPLDLQNAAAIQSALESFAPSEQAAIGGMGVAALNVTNTLLRGRLSQLGASNSMGGSLSVVGRPSGIVTNAMSLGGQTGMGVGAGEYDRQGVLPDDVSGFLAGGYIDGDSAAMPGTVFTQENQFDGFYIGGGLEKAIDNGAIGIALTYSDIDTNQQVSGRGASGELIQGTLYGVTTFSDLRLDTQISAGVYNTRTFRNVSVADSSFNITGEDAAFVFSAETGLGKVLNLGMFDLTPRVAFRAARIDFSKVAERGGGPALAYEIGDYDSYQARAGVSLAGKQGFRPFLNAEYVHDFADRPSAFTANFVGGTGPAVAFALPGNDQDWAEVSGGIGYQAGNLGLSVSAETTLWRDDLSYQSYQGAVTFRF